MYVIGFMKEYVIQWKNLRRIKRMKRGTSYALLNLRQWGKIMVIIGFFFFFFNSYAQEKEYKIEIFPAGIKGDSLKKTCHYSSYTRDPLFVLYFCCEEKCKYNIYASWLKDTLTVNYLVFYHFHITDTLSYLSIEGIDKLTDFDRKMEKQLSKKMQLVKEILFQEDKKCVIYYEGKLAYNDIPVMIRFTFIPLKKLNQKTGKVPNVAK